MRFCARFSRFQIKGPPDAEAQHHELVDAQVIHQRELVVGVGIPGTVQSRADQRTGRDWRCGRFEGNAAVIALNSSIGLKAKCCW